MMEAAEIYSAIGHHDLESISASQDVVPSVKVLLAKDHDTMTELLGELSCVMTPSEIETVGRLISDCLFHREYITIIPPWTISASTALIGSLVLTAVDAALQDHAERIADDLVDEARQYQNTINKERDINEP